MEKGFSPEHSFSLSPNGAYGVEVVGDPSVDITESNPEAEAMLETVDFTVLQDIILEQALRANMPAGEIKFFPRERIKFVKQDSQEFGLGSFAPEDNLIRLTFSEIKRTFGEQTRLGVLKILTHELTHALSKVAYVKKKDDVVLQAGYHEIGMDRYLSFNEGVVEKIARETFLEYGRRTGATKAHADFVEKPPYHYNGEVAMVDLIIGKVAQLGGVSEKVVWEAIKQGEFTGLGIDDQDTKAGFEEMLSSNFLEQLANNEVGEVIRQIFHSNENRKSLVQELVGFFRKGGWKRTKPN